MTKNERSGNIHRRKKSTRVFYAQFFPLIHIYLPHSGMEGLLRGCREKIKSQTKKKERYKS